MWERLEVWLNMQTTLRRLKAADKNTNEGSQVENVSTVVLIDLTDTSSVSQWRELVACLCESLKCVWHSSLSFGCLKVWTPTTPFSLSIPSHCFAPSHSLNIASPFVSSACPFICHSAQPHFFLFLNVLRCTRTHTCAYVVPFQRVPTQTQSQWCRPQKASSISVT